MQIEPRVVKFSLFPYFHVSKIINSLSKEAKKTFDSNWDYYWIVEYGWLFWHSSK